jgi:hypothetical protein
MRLRSVLRHEKNSDSWIFVLFAAALWAVSSFAVPCAEGTIWPGIGFPSCPLKALTGIPCPFCGMTRGCIWFAHGYLKAAWESNILSPLLMVASVVLSVCMLGFGPACRNLDARLALRMPRILGAVAGIAATVSWIINLYRKFS